jgi:hypothetical protein
MSGRVPIVARFGRIRENKSVHQEQNTEGEHMSSPQYDYAKRLVKLANGVSVKATVKLPSGREEPVFTPRQLQVFKMFVETRFNIKETAIALKCHVTTVSKLLYGAYTESKGVGVLKKLEMFHEQNKVPSRVLTRHRKSQHQR